ncbi:hypothetical protein Pint_24584 [Pistacia integerrima]|uniref:Uncharacterized protein n=1 Tax=Pistacia integerrima TaxID=434235 RepID=A0ACC0YEE8_9ROSI|nr:hypothetical protein Pint_24584 [Pistacia integerrima]
MDSSSSRRSDYNNTNNEKRHRQKFVSRILSPAIRGQNCPICLNTISDCRAAVLTDCTHAYCLHCISKWSNLKRNCPLCNAPFDSWFYKINLSTRNFLQQRLPPLGKGKTVTSQSHSSSRGPPQRIIQRSRHELISGRQEARQLPWRRSFGRPGSVPEHVIAERKLQWRASVYNQRLQAVPLSSRNCVHQNVAVNKFVKERILQRIEPWIQRELHAILGDLDPSVIVHVASSLFIASLEGKFNHPSRLLGVKRDFLAPLQPFLHDETAMFWHELSLLIEDEPSLMKQRCHPRSKLRVATWSKVLNIMAVSMGSGGISHH